MPTAHLEVSVTQVPAFRRLVAFVEDVDSYAASECDLTLREMVETLRRDLLTAAEGER